ncbi:F-box/LRR-repeat protein 2 isoform X2 [Chiloscyllium plagiosum]|uniref:F-box/LRR-repeat protein 2 isoform X2 n=1 Tax=Chiloscyllium plagiosum TaxID=36176 RepID=UPI001CB87254|nr:F-box/LRR-repeat protein 2 isoform X2 [Chiloscyllium plagiosum]
MENEAPNLPVEVISYILHFLSMSDRKEASLVSKAWYTAFLDQSLQVQCNGQLKHCCPHPVDQSNVFYHLQGTSESLELIRCLRRRQSLCVALSNFDGSPTSTMVIQNIALHLAPCLKNLLLRDSNITESSFVDLVPLCRSLWGLDLSCCNSLFKPGTLMENAEIKARTTEALIDLQELNLSNLRYLSDLTFNRLTDCKPKLRKLALAGCPIVFELDPYRGVKVCNSMCTLSLNNILCFIDRQAATLKWLDFSHTSITSEAVQLVVQVPGLQLEGLALRHCKDLTDGAVCAICSCQPRLTSLDLTGCCELTDKSVLAVANLQFLERLFLGKVRLVTDRGLKNLSAIPTLQALDLSECYQVSGLELVNGLALPYATPTLLSLNFSCCTMVKDSCVFSMGVILRDSLRELDLTSCVYITDFSISVIVNYLNGLTVLRLSWCKEITDRGLLGMSVANDNCQLNEKDEKAEIITESDLKPSKERDGASLRALIYLKELCLTACTKLTDASITKEIRFQELKTLSLNMVREITDESVVSIAEHCRSLEGLSLSHCGQLTDQGMITAANHMKRLTNLEISCCDKITSQALEVLMQECQWLRSLDVSMCSGLTIRDIERLQLAHPRLTSVKAKYLEEQTSSSLLE